MNAVHLPIFVVSVSASRCTRPIDALTTHDAHNDTHSMASGGASSLSLGSLIGPGHHLAPEEVEFVGEGVLVDVIPSMALPALCLVDGRKFGPFRPPLKATVPLWLGVSMSARRKCQLVPPPWLEVEALTRAVEAERTSPAFTDLLPFQYMEVAKVLMEAGRDDIPDSERVSSLLQDLREIRQHKIRKGLQYLDEHYLQVCSYYPCRDLYKSHAMPFRPNAPRLDQSHWLHGAE
jgi:GINS complex subunit 2